MAESRRVCTRAQQSMRSSNLFARTSRFSALVAELLISRHAPCNKFLFSAHMFHFRLILEELQGISSVYPPKGWDPFFL